MPARWLPWPVNRKASWPRGGRRCRRSRGRRRLAGRRRRARPSRSVVAVGGRGRTARWSRAARVVAREWADVDRARARRARRRGPASAAGLARAARSATGPDRTQGTAAPAGVRVRRASPAARRRLGGLLDDDVGVGAADAERRDAGAARPVRSRGHGCAPVSSAPRPPTSRRAGSARPRAGSAAARRAASPCTILMTPATPAAAWVWPMFDLTEPSHSGRSPAGPGRRWPAAPAPRSGRRAWCRCRAPRPRPRRPARARRRPAPARITRCCDGPFGAVRPLDAPSWLTARAAHAPRAPGGRCGGRRTAAPPAARRRPRPSRCRRPPRRTPCSGRRRRARAAG